MIYWSLNQPLSPHTLTRAELRFTFWLYSIIVFLFLFIYLMSFTKIVTNGEDSVLLFCFLFNLDILLRKLWNFDDIFDIFSMLRFSQISGFL